MYSEYQNLQDVYIPINLPIVLFEIIWWYWILSKVKVAKDHGRKFRSRLASSFSGIVHWKRIEFSTKPDGRKTEKESNPVSNTILQWFVTALAGQNV